METNQTQKQKHYAEPWNCDFTNDKIYSPENTFPVAEVYNDANMVRIIECVNALAQIDNPEEFIQSARDSIVEALKLKKEIELLKIGLTERFSRSEIEHLQHEVYKITGKGEVMQLFNKLLGVNAG